MKKLETFVSWLFYKYEINIREHLPPDFKEREIWWCSIGINIGKEIFGKGDKYNRPILILKKLDKYSFIGFPLTSTPLKGSWYEIVKLDSVENTVLVYQIRYYNYRRLDKRICKISSIDFERIKTTLINLIK